MEEIRKYMQNQSLNPMLTIVLCFCVCFQGGDLLTVDKNRMAGGRYHDDPTVVDSAAGVSDNFCMFIHLSYSNFYTAVWNNVEY